MRLQFTALLLVALTACSLDTSLSGPDGSDPGDSAMDNAMGDAPDAQRDGADSAFDSARIDSGLTDSGPSDSGPSDSGPADSGTPDSSPVDTSPPDTAPLGCSTGPIGTDVAVALPAPLGLTIDGRLDDWSWGEWVNISASTWFARAGPTPSGDDDLSARLSSLFTADDLYLAVVVTDDTLFNDSSGVLIWQGDSVQVAFDMAHDGGTSYDTTNDFEYGFARTSGGIAQWRWFAPTGAPSPTVSISIRRTAGTTTYEARFSRSDLGVSSFGAGDRYGFEWIVNEMDGPGSSEGIIEWTAGLGVGKNPSLFGDLVLRNCD